MKREREAHREKEREREMNELFFFTRKEKIREKEPENT